LRSSGDVASEAHDNEREEHPMTDDTSGNNGSGLRILVVGAGIAGLGAARALMQRGFAPDVVEREPTWTHTGAGIYLPGNAARALRALGLESAVAERGSLIAHQRLCDHRGRLLADIELADLWGDVGPCLALHRSDLHDVLASHRQPVPIRMDLAVQRLSEDDNTVTVEFSDATTDRYDLVIGADGVHSTTRQRTAGTRAVRPVGQRAWRFVTQCPPEVKTWTVMLGRDVTFLAVPIGRGQVYCYCDAPADGTPEPQGGEVTGRLAELLSGFAAPVPAILDALGPDGAVHVAPIEEVILDPWSYGSVLLIGDAAHATSPNMAEGAAMALEDGLVLAECLASERGIAQAMARFQARRRPRTQWVLAQTHRRDRTRNLPPALRNLVLRRWGRNIFHTNYSPLLELP
jgi:FAD-dependent urate hydroxylase